jgi:transposase-like protein
MAQVKAADVAKELGMKTQTLRKWRMHGRGPKGWMKHSKTLVTYDRAEIEEYLRTRKHRG